MKQGKMMILPPPKDVCQECAVKHDPEIPHNFDTMFYQVNFKLKNDRDPTWEDAMAHCEPEMKRRWKQIMLEEHGIFVGDVSDEQLEKAHAELVLQLDEAKNLNVEDV